MWPFPIAWNKIKDREGDDVTITLTNVERSLLIAGMMNIQYVGEKAPNSMNIGDDGDNFDAVVSSIQSKLAGA